MSNNLYLGINRREIVDLKKVFIQDLEEDYFWSHHGHTEADKERFREECRMLPEIEFKKEVLGMEFLDDYERRVYNVFYGEPPSIYCELPEKEYNVVDGRHRLAICREEGINMTLDVVYNIRFHLVENIEKDSETMKYEQNVMKSKHSIFDSIRKMLFKNEDMKIEINSDNKNNEYKLIAISHNEKTNDLLSNILDDKLVGKNYLDKEYDVFAYSDERYNDLVEMLAINNIDEKVYVSEHEYMPLGEEIR